MRAWRFHEAGDIRNLVLEEVAEPVPGPGEVLVRVVCAALNPADRYLVQGQYPRAGAPPFTPGRDGSGIVVHASENGRFKAGDAVCLLGGMTGISKQGMLAEYAAIPEEWLAPVPDRWTMEESAAAPLVHLTAWRALVVCGNLQAGETVLVTGASGGVGTASVSLATALGAKVVAFSRSATSRAALEHLGAATTVDASAPNLDQALKEAMGKERPSLIVENLGGPWLDFAARTAAPGGRIMVVGLLAGLSSEITVGLLIHKNLKIEGLSVSAFTAGEAQEAWQKIVQRLNSSAMKATIDRAIEFKDVQTGFERMAEGPFGKVVIRVATP
jgi:NADPH2:quinone reductase